MTDRIDDAVKRGFAPSEEAPEGLADARRSRFPTKAGGRSANDRSGNGFLADSALSDDMDLRPRNFVQRRLPDLGIALKSILGFWLLYLALITLRAVVLDFPDFWAMLARRGAVVLIGAALTFLVYLPLRPLAASTLNRKAVVAGTLCLPASIAFSAINYYVFYIFAPLDAAEWDESMTDLRPP